MDDESLTYILNCPHCQEFIIVHKKDIQCAIFRHGIYIENLEPIDPHLCKIECDLLFENHKIYGCGKPFQLQYDISGQPFTQFCDYI